jgi:hypothetical protein
MTNKAERVDYAFPNCLTAECLFDRHRLENRSGAAVLRFDRSLELVNLDFAHRFYSTEMATATLPRPFRNVSLGESSS